MINTENVSKSECRQILITIPKLNGRYGVRSRITYLSDRNLTLKLQNKTGNYCDILFGVSRTF
jgi:hypothetical protein